MLPAVRVLSVLEANEVNGGRLGGEAKPEPGLGGGVPVERGPDFEEEGVLGRELECAKELRRV